LEGRIKKSVGRGSLKKIRGKGATAFAGEMGDGVDEGFAKLILKKNLESWGEKKS